MSTITFCRQARRDGSVRTGIEIDQNTVLARFEQGKSDTDPALVWYVDVKFRGNGLATTPQVARAWLIRQEKAVTRLLNALADEIPAGIDPSDWPLKRERTLASGIRMVVVCSAVRRVEAAHLAEILRDLAAGWRKRLEALPQVEA